MSRSGARTYIGLKALNFKLEAIMVMCPSNELVDYESGVHVFYQAKQKALCFSTAKAASGKPYIANER